MRDASGGDAGGLPRLSIVLRALSHPDRAAIVDVLARSGCPLTISAVAARVELTRFAASRHLGILREAELVRAEQRGTRVLHSLAPGAFGVLEDWVLAIVDSEEAARLWG